MKRLGPDLKMPKLSKSDLKVPPFLVDLYWDLWDRRLLPLVVVAIAAIVAVPFVLGGSSEESPEPPATSATVAQLAAEAASPATLTVVQAEPGLRDYRRRLGHRSPTDPFKQRFSGPVITAHLQEPPAATVPTSPTNTSVTVSTPPTTTVTPEPSPSEGGESGSSPPGGAPSSGGAATPHLTLFTFAINVHVSRVAPGSDEPTNESAGATNESTSESDSKESDSNVKHRVLPLTPLPGEKAPVVTYMGTGHKQGKVLLLASRDVKSISGEATCLEGGEVCQLLEVQIGFPVTFVYGVNEVRYRIKVLKIEPVVIGHS
jgi:hypothetical protein